MTWLTAILLMITTGALAGVAALVRARKRLVRELATTRERALVAPESATVVPESGPGEAESEAAELRGELATARAESAERAAEIASLREEARLAAARARPSEQALSTSGAPSAEAAEALQIAREEARVARIAKDSFAGESRLLREELRRATARLAELTRGAATGQTATLPAEAAAPLAGRTSVWWCTACGRGGNSAEPCCANAR
jgi:hypothetical protein